MRRLLPLALAALLPACGGGGSHPLVTVPGGDADAGKQAIERYGCGSCHRIPGIDGADGRVGPPLDDFARAQNIAGHVRNTPQNLVRWILDPKAIEPGTLMPDLGLSEREARDVAAYLYSRT